MCKQGVVPNDLVRLPYFARLGCSGTVTGVEGLGSVESSGFRVYRAFASASLRPLTVPNGSPAG